MKINRNVLTIITGALLVAALPAGAQVLGGGLAGAGNAVLGGGMGQIGGGGNASVLGNFDAGSALEPARNRTEAIGSRNREVAAGTTAAAKAKAQQTRATVDGAAQASKSAAAGAGESASGAGRTASASSDSTGALSADRTGASLTGSQSTAASVKRNAPAQPEPAQ